MKTSHEQTTNYLSQFNGSRYILTSLEDPHLRFDPVISRTLSLTGDSSKLEVMAKTFLAVSAPFLEEIPPEIINRLRESEFSKNLESAERWLKASDERTHQAQIDQEPDELIIHYGKVSALAEAACCIDPSNVDKQNLFYFLMSLSSVVVDPQVIMARQFNEA